MKYILILCLFFAGCGSSYYLRKDADGRVTKIKFKALGKREFRKVVIDPETGKVEIGSSRTSGGTAAEAMLNFSKMGAKSMGIPIE